MRAKVIECVDDAFVPNEGDTMTFEFVRASFSFLEFGRWGDGLEVAQKQPGVDCDPEESQFRN